MSVSTIRTASLQDIEAMNERGDLHYDPNAPEEQLDAAFWAAAQIIEPRPSKAILLKLDPDVVDFFKKQGKGHLTRMQNVLKAYVSAHTPK